MTNFSATEISAIRLAQRTRDLYRESFEYRMMAICNASVMEELAEISHLKLEEYLHEHGLLPYDQGIDTPEIWKWADKLDE